MLNIVALMGRLTADPELRHTANNVPVTTFTLAVDRSFVKAGTERQTDFIDIVAWRGTAEFVTSYFRKGQLVAVNGSLQVRSYVDKDNNKRKAYEVMAENVHFAESKRDGGTSNQRYDDSQSPSFSNVNTGDFEEITDGDDDLPF
ncbi:MAG: single-stranded DNA-binding protein [Clostridiales bacterium 43-6]|nr:MAG: single-stranded DNA-binding protein [Clostridiales bacterium 43-6]